VESEPKATTRPPANSATRRREILVTANLLERGRYTGETNVPFSQRTGTDAGP
jgi:hypothetical protein